MSKTVLWWGRFDPDYSRNRILRQAFRELGWAVVDFRPALSALADWEAMLHKLPAVDLVWVPCFRQRDIAAARRWSRRHGVPLIVDPLISAYDKQVFERGKFAESSRRAERLRHWEGKLLRSADMLIADTAAHAEFYARTFDIPMARIRVIHVGAEEPLFHPAPMPPYDGKRPLEVLFYGSFIGLQGPQVIVEAARLYQGPPVRWVLLGEGPLKAECMRLARGLENVVFEPHLAYAELPARIHRADILLGVFGTSAKAARVIPNKVFQALACGRPVITRRGEAYPGELLESAGSGIVWLPPGRAEALAQAMSAMAGQVTVLTEIGRQARVSYERYFSASAIRTELALALVASRSGA
ncbi:glycosyltransferase involved in cell wall biosynthesis [Sulfuritortus calidifontis]|uniref:Glycosyltransferase involved in cell wall biosynthesis n=1 Tax=Sulfuritortus calidifontis TaxID=1914471 RepID=A0A4R3JU94_9PROT|nr:glycosyltransferase [Sulfuritortus calidifontis]TCS71310.1 glycosyltransferase involved in cell wall biosynthesis [Sulfuritortus calidifontis]